MASDIKARMATASMISSRVNADLRLSLAATIDIKLHGLRLPGPATRPFRFEGDQVDAGELNTVLFRELRRHALLNQLYRTVTGVDLRFLGRVGKARRRQDLANPTIFGDKCARGHAILHGAPKRKHADDKNRDSKQNFIESETTSAT